MDVPVHYDTMNQKKLTFGKERLIGSMAGAPRNKSETREAREKERAREREQKKHSSSSNSRENTCSPKIM